MYIYPQTPHSSFLGTLAVPHPLPRFLLPPSSALAISGGLRCGGADPPIIIIIIKPFFLSHFSTSCSVSFPHSLFRSFLLQRRRSVSSGAGGFFLRRSTTVSGEGSLFFHFHEFPSCCNFIFSLSFLFPYFLRRP